MMHLSQADYIAWFVARHYDVAFPRLFARTRQKDVALARRVAMFLIWRHCKWSYPAVGRFFNRDHSTVVYAVKKAKESKVYIDAEQSLIRHGISALFT